MIVAKCAAPDRHLLLPPLIRLGLPVRWQDSSVSAAFSFAYEGEQRRMSIEAIADPWTPAEAVRPSATRAGCTSRRSAARTSRPRRSRHSPAAAASRSTARASPVRPGSAPLALDADYDPAVLRFVSILKLSTDEAELLVDGYDERALGRLGVAEVVVTLGSRGCIVFADGVAELVRAQPRRRGRPDRRRRRVRGRLPRRP